MVASKLFSISVAVAIAIYGAVGWYCLPMAEFEGELTRMGKLPEFMFGWNKSRVTVPRELLKPVSWQDADVLVIGDSFSAGENVNHGRVWQSVLVRNGLRVRTEHWANVRGICEDFYSWVRAQGFKGKWIIFEIVERNIEDGLPKAANCKTTIYHPSVYTDRWRVPPLEKRPVSSGMSGKMSVAIETGLNAYKYWKMADAPTFRSAVWINGTTIARVPHGCELFSHENCNDAIFLTQDSPAEVNYSVFDEIEKINSRLQDITPIWVFVPNKSTAYLYPNKSFWDEAERRLYSPNILRIVKGALEIKTVDLYPANNQHFSTEGYLLMGDEIFRTLQKAELKVPG